MIYNPRNPGNDTTESQKEKNVYCNAHFQYSHCKITGLNRGHSKSTFVKEERGGSLSSEQKRTGGVGVLPCVYVRFYKKNALIFKIKFYSYSPVFPLIIMAV